MTCQVVKLKACAGLLTVSSLPSQTRKATDLVNVPTCVQPRSDDAEGAIVA